NFFNASRTLLGSPVSVSGDLPQLTGGLRSMSALDLDVVDVTALVAPNDTTASVNIKAGGDNNILLGALCTAITTFKPNFNESIKTATDLNGGTLLAGDVLRYTIDVINTGNDPAIDVVLEDSLPAGVTYVPGSIQVTSDLVPSKTDVAGDDQGEFDSGSNLVRVRLGAGADDVNGGTMGIGETATVVFDVQVDADFVGVVSNRAQIVASGQSGAPETTYGSDDGNGGGSTDVVVDQCAGDGDCPLLTPRCFDPASPGQPNLCVECLTSADCSGTSPICDTGAHTCEPCAADSECDDKDALNPACQDTGSQIGACGECSENTDLLCSGSKPECLISLGICGCSDSDGDSECGASDSGIICNGPAGECVPGCSTAPQRNDCPADENCSKQDGTVGSCLGQPCQTSTDCTDPLLPVCDTVPNPHTCVACVVDTDCTAPLLCNPSRACVECTSDRLDNCSAADSGAACLANETCGCLTDDDCGASDSGRVCDGATSHCILGCRGTGGNGCEVPQVCTSTDNTIGSCVACTSNDDCTAPQVCDQTSDPPACVDCVTTADCDGALVCDETQQTCVECVKSSDCLAPQVCDTTAQQCVDCVVDPDCGSAMVCDKTTQTCIGCTDDADCTAGKLCDKTTQTCVECTDDSDCAAGKFCDGTTRTCVGCNSDADCAPAGSGLVCDTTEHSCVAGKTTRKDSVEGGGCACSLPASSRRPLPLLALLPLALLLGRRRHRVSRRKQTRSLPQ
ncbi:MAG TPA: MYXO-CTERM sorting domain-containing protein, partial [Polyangiaceae bacterium]|nr:MYXO-CTERM sorting domain-containing protein [Polyangiaceae bacterium]